MHEVAWTGSFTDNPIAGTNAAPGSALTSFAAGGTATRLYYLDSVSRPHAGTLRRTYSWSKNLTANFRRTQN